MVNEKKERNVTFQDERRPVVVHYDIELDDAGLDPYQFRIYQRIARRCAGLQQGECFESLGAMAADCKMSRPTVVRAIKVLIQRQMIRRLSRQGETSFYALTDKTFWLPFAEWQSRYAKQPSKPEIQGVVNDRTTTRSTTDSGGGSVVYTKKTHEEYKKERAASSAENQPSPKLSLVSSVEEKPTEPEQPFSPTDDFSESAPEPTWTTAERFVLKACDLWDELSNQEKPVVETNWKTKESVKNAGKYVMPRLSVEKRVGGSPRLFKQFWHETLKRNIAPRPDYVIEQWEAYDRWLIENYETHRRIAA